MTNAGGRSPSRPRDGSERSCGAAASTPADLARTRALALAATAGTRTRTRGFLLPAALGLVLGGRLVTLVIGLRLLLLRRLFAALGEGPGLGGRDASRALLLLLLDALHQFEVGGLAGVTETVTQADDARVTALALLVPGRDGREQLRHDLGLDHEASHVAASGDVALLAERDHALGKAARLLRLRHRGLDALVLEQSGHQVAQQCASVLALSSQPAVVFAVSHVFPLDRRAAGPAEKKARPRPAPRTCSRSTGSRPCRSGAPSRPGCPGSP